MSEAEQRRVETALRAIVTRWFLGLFITIVVLSFGAGAWATKISWDLDALRKNQETLAESLKNVAEASHRQDIKNAEQDQRLVWIESSRKP